MTAISEASDLIGRLTAQAGPSVVGLGPGWRGGSGVVIGEGRVLTAAHNLRGDEAGVVFADGRRLGVNVIRLDGGLIVAVDAVALAGDIARLGEGRAPAHRRLGVAVAPPYVARRLRRAVGLPEHTGILVRAVEDGSPADAAGLERGDLLVAVGGTPLERVDDLYRALD